MIRLVVRGLVLTILSIVLFHALRALAAAIAFNYQLSSGSSFDYVGLTLYLLLAIVLLLVPLSPKDKARKHESALKRDFLIFSGLLLLYKGCLISFQSWERNSLPTLQFISLHELLVYVILAPICEEFWFRGFAWNQIVAGKKTKFAVAIASLSTSLSFAWAHFPVSEPMQKPVLLVPYIVFGMLMAGARTISKTVTLCIFLHALGNLIGASFYFQ